MKKIYYFLILISLALFFRIFFTNNFAVGFDQVQILRNAKLILSGDLSLVGPRTGPADMFTGPLIYYLSVPFVYFFGELRSISLVPLFISFLTGIFLYLLCIKYLDFKKALIITTIWAFSPFLISLDRVFWNPDLTLLSASLIFIPLLEKERVNKLTFWFLMLGSFLSYQAHFSGFLLLFLGFISIIYLKKPIKLVFALIAGIALSLIPTLIFDLRNNFSNWNGLIGFLSSKNEFILQAVAKDFLHNLYILAETFGKIFLFANNQATIVALAVMIFLIALKNIRHNKLAFLWLLTIAIVYSFYQGEKPEYYFLISVPALLIISANLLEKIEKKYLLILATLFIFNSTLINFAQYKNNFGITTGNIEKIQNYLSKKEIKEIIYDVPRGAEDGLKYFLADKISSSGETIHIGYPSNLSFSGIEKVGDINVWIDQRKTSKNYVTTDSYILESNPNYFLFKNLYPIDTIQNFDLYEIVKDKQVMGKLLVTYENLLIYKNKEQLDWVKACLEQKENNNYNWTKFSTNSYARFQKTNCLLLELEKENNFEAIGIRIF